MSPLRAFAAALIATAFSLAACSSNGRQEGPAERAGEKIDSGFEKMGEKMEQAGEKMQEKARGD